MGHSVNKTTKYTFNSKLTNSKNALAFRKLVVCVLHEDGERFIFLGLLSGFGRLSLHVKE